jgi:hypothetical protein
MHHFFQNYSWRQIPVPVTQGTFASRVQKISSWPGFALHSGACHGLTVIRAGLEISSLSRRKRECSVTCLSRHDDNGFASILAVIYFPIWHLNVVMAGSPLPAWPHGTSPKRLHSVTLPSRRMLAACSRLLEYSKAVGSPRRCQPLTSTICKDARAEAIFVPFGRRALNS